MYVYKYCVHIILYILCMIKVRVRWCTFSLWSFYSVPPPLYCVFENSKRNNLDPPVMGTIFLVTLTLLAFVHTNNVTERKAAYTGQEMYTQEIKVTMRLRILYHVSFTHLVLLAGLSADTPKKEDDTAEHLRT